MSQTSIRNLARAVTLCITGAAVAGLLLYALLMRLLAMQPSPEIPLFLREHPRFSAVRSAFDADGSRLDLNAATLEELIALPGIGEVTAQAILELRDLLGAFRYPEDLLLVKGIGAKKLDAIYDSVYAGGANE